MAGLAQHLGVDVALVEVTGKEGKVFFFFPIELYSGCFPACVGRQNHSGTAKKFHQGLKAFPKQVGLLPMPDSGVCG